MSRSIFRSWFRQWRRSLHRGRRPDWPQRHRGRPHVEFMEDRCVPSTVTNLNDAGPGTFRDAIAATPAGGTVDFDPALTGMLTLTSAPLSVTKDLTIRGPGPATLSVSGGGKLQVFNIAAGVTVSISGLGVVNGSGGLGSPGGGIDNEGALTLTNCTISGNFVGIGKGGGIYNHNTLTLLNCLVNNNHGEQGGGIYSTGTLTLMNSTLSGNTNGAHESGGGLYVETGSAVLTDCTIAQNTSMTSGGGVWMTGGSVVVTNCTITNNNGFFTGGGIGMTGGMLTVSNSTIAANISGESGGSNIAGGIAIQGGTLSLHDSILAGNTQNGVADVSGSVATALNNLIGTGSGDTGLVNGVNGNQVGTASAPLGPKLGPLQNNGGPTQTMALLPGSPAIDAGDNTAAPPWDQRGPGFPRIVHGTIDLGAVEWPGPPLGSRFFTIGGAPGRVQVRRVSDGSLLADFAPFGASYTGRVSVAVGDLNHDGTPDLVVSAADFVPYVKVYDGSNFVQGTFDPVKAEANLLASFFAYDPQFGSGADVAVGNILGDGYPDLVTGATAGNPQVRVFSGKDIANHIFNPTGSSLVAQWFAYGLQFNIGVNVAAGVFNPRGFADIVTGATAGNPHVKIYSGEAIADHTFAAAPEAHVLTQFFAYGLQQNLGVSVAVGYTNGQGAADLITGATAGSAQVQVFDGSAIALGTFDPNNPAAGQRTSFVAYSLEFPVGVYVAAADFENNGQFDILTGAGTGAPHYRVVKGNATGVLPPSVNGIEGIPTDFQGGVGVAA